MTRTVRTVVLAAVFAAGLLPGCGDEPEKKNNKGGNYAECTDAPQNNPVLVCDSMLRAVEKLCGFSLTVDPCACYDEVAPCAVSSEGISEVVMAFLEGILACEDSASDCSGYITCLEVLGEADSCSNPVDWSCITTTDAQEQSGE